MPFDPDAVTWRTVSTVAQFINLHEQLGAGDGSWAFRGQSQEFKNLVPSIQRRLSPDGVGAAELIEQDLLRTFREHYAKMPERSADMPAPVTIGVGFDLRCLSVMQHYEVPTRLLDWSTDLWTALYFACSADAEKNAELWMYNRDIFRTSQWASDFEKFRNYALITNREPTLLGSRGTATLIELDPRISPRMQHQKAHHTVSSAIFSDHAVQLWELAGSVSSSPNTHFARLIIDKSCKSKVLQFLANHKNMTASTIFPDVVGLGRFLRSQLDSLCTMMQ